MSVPPDWTIRHDPNAETMHGFGYTAYLGVDASIDDYELTIVALGPNSTPLEIDEDGTGAFEAANGDAFAAGKGVKFRLKGGTLRTKYRITCRIVTDETPAQTDERSVYVQVVDR